MTEPREILLQLRRDGVVPVLAHPDPELVAGAADALAEGGLRCVEVALRSPSSLGALAEVVARGTGLLVGAGTVVSIRDVDAAADAGARFIVSPGLDEAVLARARHHGLAAVPGVATATELHRALRAGAELVKLFPAALLGGPSAIRALAAPFPGARFLPSGGITRDDLGAYLAHPSVWAVGGGWLTPAPALEAGDLAAIRREAALTVEAVSRARA